MEVVVRVKRGGRGAGRGEARERARAGAQSARRGVSIGSPAPDLLLDETAPAFRADREAREGPSRRQDGGHPVPREAQLAGASFYRADLESAAFQRARLQGALFDGAHLSHAVFVSAQLDGARFGAPERPPRFLPFAQLHGAALTLVDLSEADLTGADLRSADLRGRT